MKENRYHIDESKLSGDMVNEPAAAYRDAAVAEPTMHQSAMDWDDSFEEDDDEAYNTDSYPMGRSLEQVRAHCESLLDKLDDPNYGRPIEELDAEIDKMIAGWR